VLAQVHERGARAIAAAPHVDALVAERGAHLIEVVHRDGGCVQPGVGVERRLASAGFSQVGSRRKQLLQG
jgi:hypothetical protein